VDIVTGHVSAGTLSDRVVIENTRVTASLNMRPKKKRNDAKKAETVRRKGVKDYSYISPDRVFRYVYDKRRHRPGKKRKRRVYGAIGADNNERLEWDLASGFRKFLTGWQLRGAVNSHAGRLLTPLFPLRNNISLIDLTFSNDTVALRNISMIAGKSDLAFSGLITNVEHALTSKTDDTLKANLAITCDTIDINQISAAILTGASSAHDRREGKLRMAAAPDDATLERHIDALAAAGPGKVTPILIPVNIDANLRLDAGCMLYSDLKMDKMGCDVLVYDGGVNIHDLHASSDAGELSVSALYSAPNTDRMHVGFGMELNDFNIAKFVTLVPALDSIVPLMRDFSGMISADVAATCGIDAGMNLILPSLDAAVRITGDNLAFIDPKKYRTLGKWLGFKDKADNTIKRMNVELTVTDGMMRVYPFAFNIDRYRLGISGSNDIAMNFNYHIAVLKSPLPFRFGINISGHPGKYKVRFGGAKFKEETATESVSVVNAARINLLDQIENIFKRGVRNSRFAKLQIALPEKPETREDTGLSASDSILLIQEGLMLDQDSIH
ncbi:MAG: AsmA-like C-terminal region-containing protein, partial [Muribaculaceae bacterium]|nr:AsmA-like C-terminal region-containing protein [Muribaculaceae bacterium]